MPDQQQCAQLQKKEKSAKSLHPNLQRGGGGVNTTPYTVKK